MDAPTDTFTHADRVYDLSKVRILVRPDKTFLLPINELLWIFKHDVPNEDRVIRAKIRYPLLVARYRGKWAVVDGLHRLERYRRRGIKVIPVKYVRESVLQQTLIHIPK